MTRATHSEPDPYRENAECAAIPHLGYPSTPFQRRLATNGCNNRVNRQLVRSRSVEVWPRSPCVLVAFLATASSSNSIEPRYGHTICYC
jgi:hypothetical protein